MALCRATTGNLSMSARRRTVAAPPAADSVIKLRWMQLAQLQSNAANWLSMSAAGGQPLLIVAGRQQVPGGNRDFSFRCRLLPPLVSLSARDRRLVVRSRLACAHFKLVACGSGPSRTRC